jgi:hypothetical protein
MQGYSRVLKGSFDCVWQALDFADRPGLQLRRPVALITGCQVPHEYHAALKSLRHLIILRTCTYFPIGACFQFHAKRLPGRAWYILDVPSCGSNRSPLWDIAELVNHTMSTTHYRPLSVTFVLLNLQPTSIRQVPFLRCSRTQQAGKTWIPDTLGCWQIEAITSEPTVAHSSVDFDFRYDAEISCSQSACSSPELMCPLAAHTTFSVTL